jgi:hypothetical protein
MLFVSRKDAKAQRRKALLLARSANQSVDARLRRAK